MHALKFSEGEAYRRIRAVRAVRKRPELLACLQEGSLTLNSLVLLHPHLDLPHGDEALRRAKGLGTGALERVLAEYVTAPAERDTIRFVGMEAAGPAAPMPLTFETPAAISAGIACEPGAPPPVAVLPARRKLVRFKFMADEELFRLVRHAQALLRHKYPDGRLEGVFRDALTVLLAKRDPIFRSALAARLGGRKK